MIFPIYGEVSNVADCSDPEASRQWLSGQRGVYRELREDGLPKTRGGGGFKSFIGIQTAGSYLVGIANDAENIPTTLAELRKVTPRPEHVPDAPDKVLEIIDNFYRLQKLGMPQFVIAAFALDPGQTEKKNPITLQYTQAQSLGNALIFPALDYHGQGGGFDRYVDRDHRLLFSTKELNEAFDCAMRGSHTANRPAEFVSAPTQFPIELKDTRKGSADIAISPPNNDYIFDADQLHDRLAGVNARLKEGIVDDSSTIEHDTPYGRSESIGIIMTEELGRNGLMQFSNQAGTTVDAHVRDNKWDSRLYTDNF